MSSAATLTTLRDRVEELLADTGNAVFSTSMLAECVRLALEEFSLVYRHEGGLHLLNGLDSATRTTFSVLADGMIVLGAAGYACLARASDLNETAANMAVSTPNYGTLGQLYLAEFRGRMDLFGRGSV